MNSLLHSASDSKKLVPVDETSLETSLTLASAHALVLLDDGVIGDPMEKTTLDALKWKLNSGDRITPTEQSGSKKDNVSVTVRRRFQFSSQLKRMSTISLVQTGPSNVRTLVAVKGAPETLKSMYTSVPADYEKTYKWFAQRGSRVLALGYKWVDGMNKHETTSIARDQVESELVFAGFLVFHCPLKPDAVKTLKDLADASHRCVMITGDNPLTAVSVAKDVEIVDREALILDRAEGASSETGALPRRHCGFCPGSVLILLATRRACLAHGRRVRRHSGRSVGASRHVSLRQVRHLHDRTRRQAVRRQAYLVAPTRSAHLGLCPRLAVAERVHLDHPQVARLRYAHGR